MSELPAADVQDFNSRAHVERDRVSELPAADVQDFNSRAHVERD